MARLDDLERLNALRESGVLTWEEYLAEKAKLPSAGEQPSKIGWRLPRNAGEFQRSRWALLVLPLSFLAVWGVKYVGRSFNDTPQVQSAQLASNGSPWTISTKTDPLTDVIKNMATMTVQGTLAVIEVTLSCGSDGSVRYEAVTSDQHGQGAEMRSDINADGVPVIPFDVRVDSEPPIQAFTLNPKFNNQVVAELDAFNMARAERARHSVTPPFWAANLMARGARVLVQLHLATGEELITLDQTGPDIRNLLRPCIVQADAAAEAQAR